MPGAGGIATHWRVRPERRPTGVAFRHIPSISRRQAGNPGAVAPFRPPADNRLTRNSVKRLQSRPFCASAPQPAQDSTVISTANITMQFVVLPVEIEKPGFIGLQPGPNLTGTR